MYLSFITDEYFIDLFLSQHDSDLFYLDYDVKVLCFFMN